MPKYSIIIPAHNDGNRIHRALGSIRAQTYKDYELIVICDACKDNTEAVAKKYGAITKAVDFQHDGLSRNAGLDIASGKWVLFMDSDDWWIHEYVLETIDREIRGINPDVLAFGFIWRGVGLTRPVRPGNMLWPNVWSKAWSREIIGDTRFSEEWSVSDMGFTNAVLAKKPKVAALEDALYYYNYMREGSISEMEARKKDG